VISDHDARVLDRRMIRGNVWQAIAALPWAQKVGLVKFFVYGVGS
jgi:hypothetical protein